MNTKFILSGYSLKSEKLEAICENCEKDGFYLYVLVNLTLLVFYTPHKSYYTLACLQNP